MDPIPIYSEKETFYVPKVEIYIRDQKLPSNIIADVLEVSYKDNVKEIDSCTLEINNWDARKRTFKFSPPLSDASNAGIFDPGSSIEIWLGYQNNLRQMMKGRITSLAPHYSESASTLSVTALNQLNQFRTEQHTWAWPDGNKTDTQIAQDLCGRPVKKGQPGLGINIETNPSPNEMPDTFVFMNSQYDILFLLERARRRGYEVYLKDVNGVQTLYFGLSESKALAPVYQLEWGKSLIDFQPTLSTAKQVAQVTVRGWDRKSNTVIEETFKLEDLWKAQNKSAQEIARLRQIAKAFSERSEVVTDHPVHTRKEAKQLARAILEDQSKKMVEATGSTIGLPDLRTGCALRILGFGLKSQKDAQLAGACSDFDGEYYVTQTTHTIGNGGYKTQFSARREGPVALPQPQQ